MKRLGIVALLALAGLACRNEPDLVAPDPCSDVARVVLTARNAGGQPVYSALVGEYLQLDATPMNAEGQPVNQVCHAPAVVWRWTQATCSLIGDTAGFNPQLRADAAGLCELRAIVGAVTGELVLRISP